MQDKNNRTKSVIDLNNNRLIILINYLKKKLNPPYYQGTKKCSQHFEGWYYKIVDKSERHIYAVIPGVFINKTNQQSHSFIQVFDGGSRTISYNKFPIQDFHSSDRLFEIKIHSNYFSCDKIVLDLKSSSMQVSGELNFQQLTPWRKTLISPGIMGWYTWVPFMECYHGIISLDHKIVGALSMNDRKLDFTSGKGYTEKDWGKSFPEAWVWCQSNHFNSKNTSVTGSIAIIPWIRRPFLGFILGLYYEKKLYRFATYNGARLVHFDVDNSKAHWIIEQQDYILEMNAHLMEGGFLQAPTIDSMKNRIFESLTSTVEIVLRRASIARNQIIFQDIGKHAGLEIGGDLPRLKEMYDKYKMKLK